MVVNSSMSALKYVPNISQVATSLPSCASITNLVINTSVETGEGEDSSFAMYVYFFLPLAQVRPFSLAQRVLVTRAMARRDFFLSLDVRNYELIDLTTFFSSSCVNSLSMTSNDLYPWCLLPFFALIYGRKTLDSVSMMVLITFLYMLLTSYSFSTATEVSCKDSFVASFWNSFHMSFDVY